MSRFITPTALALLITLLYAGGCSSHPAPTAKKFEASAVDRNHGYALLYSLVGKNQDVEKILAIKKVTPATEAIIKDISALCKEAKETLDSYAQGDATLGMADQGLPPYEVQTRDAIESTTTKRLLFSSGELFEKRLLQTQAQSTNYLSHLALMLGKNDVNKTRATYLEKLSERADNLHTQIMDRLTINTAAVVEAQKNDQ